MLTTIAVLCSLVVPPPAGSHAEPGRFAVLRNLGGSGPVSVANTTYNLLVERVLKVQALVPRRSGTIFGVPVYAGSFAVAAPDSRWSFSLPDADRTTTASWPEHARARVVQTIREGGWSANVSADLALDYPAIWFGLTRTVGSAPLHAGMVGYEWAKRAAPTDWEVQGAAHVRRAGKRLSLRIAPIRAPLVVTYLDGAGFAGALRFDPAPDAIAVDDDGITWTYAPDVDTAQIACSVLPGVASHVAAIAVAEMIPVPPGSIEQRFQSRGSASSQPSIELRVYQGQALCVPVSLADNPAVSGVSVDSPQGRILLLPVSHWARSIPTPPLIDASLPDLKPLSAAERQRLTTLLQRILAAQKPDGSFAFNGSRAFYDGMTLAALAETSSLLPGGERIAVRDALEKGLRHLWEDGAECKVWPGTSLPPEGRGFLDTGVDYPEILGCVVQATERYSEAFELGYARSRWPAIQRQFEQLRQFMDTSGIALAHPGPDRWHVIAESAIGGYLAWQGMYRLAVLADKPEYAAEARARAALAWKAWRTMFAWRKEYGEPRQMVNGILDGQVQLEDDPAWTYVQSTFFTHLPCFALPSDDIFGVWRELDRQPWYDWTGKLKSTQRVYDDCNAIALARAGRLADVRAHWADVAARPYEFGNFDQSPSLGIAAIVWLASLGIER